MKKHLKYIAVGLAAFSVTSCADLDTELLGGTISSEQREDVIQSNPELANAGIVAVNSNLNRRMSVYSEHFDFGYPAVMLGLDHQTADLNGPYSGYNWFNSWGAFAGMTSTGTQTSMAWYHCYRTIKIANDAILSFLGTDPELKEPQNAFFVAQGYAYRAYLYWVLANLYQFNPYTGEFATEDSPCVPIITHENAELVAFEGAPRASVKDVYAQIVADLNKAVELIEASGVAPEDVIGVQAKRFLSKAAVYGLRARVNLTMANYTAAAQDAQAAIANHSGRPYTFDEVSVPTFTSMEDPSWMWGIAIAETDATVKSGLVNWPSHLCTFSYGYVMVGAFRYCSKDLYDAIPSADVRKGWFLDANYTSKNLTPAQQNFVNQYIATDASDIETLYNSNNNIQLMPYTNVKFNSYQGVLNQDVNASDVPLMRVEEMYYILAEAQAMSGNVAAGVETLQNFVVNYRNPKYACYATTAEEVQEEVFQQRRVELWGEGLLYFDYMRLNKGVDRRSARAPFEFTYDIQPGDPVLIYCIPDTEIAANAQITDEDNNEPSSRPVVVDWAQY